MRRIKETVGTVVITVSGFGNKIKLMNLTKTTVQTIQLHSCLFGQQAILAYRHPIPTLPVRKEDIRFML